MVSSKAARADTSASVVNSIAGRLASLLSGICTPEMEFQPLCQLSAQRFAVEWRPGTEGGELELDPAYVQMMDREDVGAGRPVHGGQ